MLKLFLFAAKTNFTASFSLLIKLAPTHSMLKLFQRMLKLFLMQVLASVLAKACAKTRELLLKCFSTQVLTLGFGRSWLKLAQNQF